MTRRVTMRDVAKAVSLSPMTISRALRDDETVNAKTRDLVKQTAAKLGYVYDGTAQAFRTQKSGFVAITLPSINNANFAETFRGLSNGLEGLGTQILLGSTNYQVEKEHELVLQLLARKPEAIVLTGGFHMPQTRSTLEAAQIPIIEVWDLPTEPLDHVVGFSNADAMGAVVRHLAETGRRNLAFIGASDGSDMRGSARRDGAITAARELGLPEITMVDAGEAPVSMKQGAAAVSRLGRGVQDFDALVCVSDPVAFGALSECRRMGLSVPDDIAISGFGDFDLATVSDPRITTVGVHAKAIGVQTAEVLSALFDGDTTTRRIDVGFKLVVGETT